MIVLCTHNCGGVGKTTLAIHAAGTLASYNRSTLLIDCDDQADSWQFYAKQIPGAPEMPAPAHLLKFGNFLSILDNQKRVKITKLKMNALAEYQHIVIDIDSEFLNTIRAKNIFSIQIRKSAIRCRLRR